MDFQSEMWTVWPLFFFFLVIVNLHYGIGTDPDLETEEIRAADFMRFFNQESEKNYKNQTLYEWNYANNLTEHNLQLLIAVKNNISKSKKSLWQEAVKFNWPSFSDPILRRQFKKIIALDIDALPPEKLVRLTKIISEMEKIYATAKIPDPQDTEKHQLISLEPDIINLMATSRSADQLNATWSEWHQNIGPHVRQLYREYVDLSNEAAHLNNFTNTGEYWIDSYEDPTIREQIEAIWLQLKPLYMQLHAYVRSRLRQQYGPDVVGVRLPIPAHLLGNMWAQDWENIAEFTLPFPEQKDESSVNDELVQQNYTIDKIFRTADEFFQSIGMRAMPANFWANSVLEKPKDRDIICHASAWDFYHGDVRIKQCTRIKEESFVNAHHEMGHIQYYLEYQNQPVPFREGANNGFHEAVGDLISLSVLSRKHLRKVGLLKTKEDNPEILINKLYKMSLSKIAFLPFSYSLDLWRWEVFAGRTTPETYNCKWWELREKYQGLEPPGNRTLDDFDAAAKYHVVAGVSYIRYFISYVIQFQFHKALCEKAGQYSPEDKNKPLHECDIYQSVEAGNALKSMLQLGASKPWPDALELLTGRRTMDAGPFLEYFQPLRRWLEEQNKKEGNFVGWEKSEKVVQC